MLLLGPKFTAFAFRFYICGFYTHYLVAPYRYRTTAGKKKGRGGKRKQEIRKTLEGRKPARQSTQPANSHEALGDRTRELRGEMR